MPVTDSLGSQTPPEAHIRRQPFMRANFDGEFPPTYPTQPRFRPITYWRRLSTGPTPPQPCHCSCHHGHHDHDPHSHDLGGDTDADWAKPLRNSFWGAPATDLSGSLAEKTGDGDEAPLIQGEAPPRNMGKLRWAVTCLSIYSATLLYGLDTTIVADVQVPIVQQFGEISKMTWIGAAFPLGSVSVILALGTIYASFDAKWLYIGSFAIFETGSALCGAAPNMNALIIGRIIAGMGGSGIYLGNLNIMAKLTTIQERPMYNAGAGIGWGVGAILGPVLGGAFAKSSATWRWAFYINLVVAAISGPTYVLSLPSLQPRPGVSFFKKLSEVDILGAVIFASIFAMFIIPLTLAEGSWQWSSPGTIICLVLSAMLAVTFFIQQRYSLFTSPERRVFPAELLRHKTLILLFICTASTSTNLFIPVYYIPTYFQFTRGDEPIQAAVRLLPFILFGVFTTMFSGAVMPRSGFYMPWYLAGGICGTTGGALMYSVKTTTPAGAVYVFSILVAIGAGCSLQLGYSIAQAKLPVSKQPAAIRYMNMAQLGGTTIALTIAGRLFQSYSFRNVKSAVDGLGFTDAQITAAVSGAQDTLFDSLSPAIREAVLEGIVKAVGKVYILVTVGACSTLTCSLFMDRERLFQKGKRPVDEPVVERKK